MKIPWKIKIIPVELCVNGGRVDFPWIYQDNQEMGENQHGGRRVGSGRKPQHPEGATREITVNIPDTLIKKLERLAKKRGYSRSAAVTEAVRRLVKS